jgi:hypothetical protein
MRQMMLATMLLLAPFSVADAAAEKSKPSSGSTPLLEVHGHALQGKPWAEQEALRSLSELHGLDQIAAPVFDVAPQDNEFFLAEDDVLGHGNGPKPLRFAVPIAIGLDIVDGDWLTVEGGHLWRCVIKSANAHTARLHLKGLRLASGQEMRLSSPGWEGSVVGPIEGTGEFGTGEAWSMSFPTSEVLVEWFVPKGSRVKELPFAGVEYLHGYRQIWKFEGPGDGGVAAAGTCHLDPVCFPTWANESNGTVRLIFGGFLCSGQLTATTAADETPYVSTANHCISTQAEAASCQFNFFYRRNTCAAAAVASAGVNILGGDLTSTYLASDCTLLMARPTLPATAYWVGWTNANVPTNTLSTGLHHPAGDYQRISFGVKNAAAFNCGAPTTNWSSLSWNPATQYGVTSTGVTEGGSSGSAIYRNTDKLMYGVLTCGASACNNVAADDGYGRWDVAVNTGGFATLLAAGSDDTIEQNDSCAAAIGVTAGTTYSNLVVKRLDEDWYLLPVPVGATLNMNLTFTHANGDVECSIFADCAGAALVSRTADTNNEVFSFTNTSTSNTLRMRVWLGADTRNNYNMSFTVTVPAPGNDDCVTATPVLPGSYAFDTTGATTSTPTIAASCTDGAGATLNKDVWFRYVPECDGTATISTCGLAAFDTRIIVYLGAVTCPTAATTVYACNDDGAGCTALTSTVSFPCTAAQQFYVRIGSKSVIGGPGTVSFVCAPSAPPCPADIDGNGAVDASDLASLLASWGTCTGCAADLDANGTVDAADLATVLAAWGACP